VTKPNVARFWAKVDKNGPVPPHVPELGNCWIWTGATGYWGYGRLSLNKRWSTAHRMSFELAYGAIPEGKFILHRCDTPACVRPDHLRLGTPQENTRDMYEKGRAGFAGPKGEDNSHAKLTEQEVIAIRQRFARGELIRRLAVEYQVTVSTLSNIVNGRTWKHVGGPTRPPGQLGRRPRKAA
jgi:hypothetical protein